MSTGDIHHGLWLDPIPEDLRAEAVRRFHAEDESGFLMLAGNHDGLALVCKNADALRAKGGGMYERALLDAWTMHRLNHAGWSVRALHSLFSMADRSRLLTAGDPLPGRGPFTVYRGVTGKGRARRVRGFSWTANLDLACWFAERFVFNAVLRQPGVYRLEIQERDVLAYLHEPKGRSEEEFLVQLPEGARPRRVHVDLRARAAVVAARYAERREQLLMARRSAGNT